MDKHLEYLKSLKWRIPTVRNIQPTSKCKVRCGKKLTKSEEEHRSGPFGDGDCFRIKKSRFAKSLKKYTPRFKRRKAILSSPQEVYHRFETVPEIQFSYNPTANVNGGVVKFTGSSSPGIVKTRKRQKRSKLWNLSKIWKITKVEQYYDSFAEDLILLSSV
ncbi:protein kinase domain-containing protein [Caerostris darwini]|uniref:Protein kinase domain-containing protein n=1 Tax=Caerostris darwini TaxID=1538125 RepID=A0AAV4PZJ3_9ARAC|nr:protein kinase domain-containing protein [Caerostris darwini]